MKFSFVVPVYKKSATILRKCLKSLVEQSHKDIEIIVAFDGDDQDYQAVLGQFKDPAIHKAITISHAGASAARNAGATLATGDFISFWDADCIAEPNMAAGWALWLERYPEIDFVYSGYKWTDPRLAGYESQRFDPWVLEHYNYLAPMFPLRREKAVSWDESLAGLQDWDYWRRVVKAGARGLWVDPGGTAYPFATEPPDADSISGPKANVEERISVLRTKFADPCPDILVLPGLYKEYAIEFAKILGADYFENPAYWKIRTDYKAIFFVGFDSETKYYLDMYANEPAKKIVYWQGADAEAFLQEAPVKVVNAFREQVKNLSVINICPDKRTHDLLKEAGVDATIISYPMRLNVFDARSRKPSASW
jgi:glycosyltransferase involved in cell wall biosynthesis